MAGLGKKTWSPLDVLTAADMNGYLMDQSVMKFASSTARSSALGTGVSAGMVSFRADGTAWEGYNGSTWGPLVNIDTSSFITASSTATLTNKSMSADQIDTVSTDKSANYTLVAGDANTFIRSTNSAITITVPDVLANGESVNFIQAGAGQITFSGSGVTLYSADSLTKTAKQYAGATIVKSGGAYYLIGNLG